MNTKTFLLMLFAALTMGMGCTKNNQENPDLKQKAVSLLKSIETGDSTVAEAIINPNNYIQHNVTIANGLSGFKELLKFAPRGSTTVNPVRVFEDGNYVFTQSDIVFFAPQVGFDIFRFQDGKIVEHWDNLQVKPASANPSGHTMIDGTTMITDKNRTDENKRLVNRFLTDVLVNGQRDKLAFYFNGNNYIEHNPQASDGVSNLGDALQASSIRYSKVHKVLGEGNFVLAISEGIPAGKPTSYYDLFRVENSKIVEHWDVVETIAPESEWRNNNGKFNFPNE